MTISNLSQLIAAVESNNNPKAVRFEPSYHPHGFDVQRMAELCKCTYATAQILCACSWGKHQIMGDNLIGLGLDITPMEFCTDNDYQEEYFLRFIRADHITITLTDVLTSPTLRNTFARLYNGPSNVAAYAERLVQVAKANGLEVVS
jgi:hypothetical protein